MPNFTEAELKEWLNNPSSTKLITKGRIDSTVLIKIPLNDDFDFIYHQHHFNSDDLEINQQLEFEGIYCQRDGCIYNPGYRLRSCCDSTSIIKEHSDKSDVKKTLSELVSSRVDEIIGNDRSNLTVKEIKSDEYRRNIEYHQQYGAERDARRMFLKEKGIPEVKFHCTYEIDRLSDESYLKFIADRNSVVEEMANDVIQNHQEAMLALFIRNDYLQNELDKITEDPSNILHKIRAIIGAVKDSGAKMVNVTINKNGEDFTFKYEADKLTFDPGNHYSSWWIKASDRQEFESKFGRHEDFYPEEITQITYSRNVIFDSSEFDMAETEDCAIEQTM